MLAALAEPAVPERHSQDVEARLAALLARMTLYEKVGQLTQFASWGNADATGPEGARRAAEREALVRGGGVGSLLNVTGAEAINRYQRLAVEESRLGIPILFGHDVIHGYRTIFPVPLALAASFDPALVEETARLAAREARAAGLHWTFAPMVDVARDARWGRVVESSGEDAFLGAAMAAAAVRGFNRHIMSCAKHFAGYGAAQAGRDYNTVDLSEQTLRQVYLPPFAAAIGAGVDSIMPGFHDLNGVPATGNAWLLSQVLRRDLGFKGFVVSDYGAVAELVVHGVAADRAAAGRRALVAGVDMDMESGVYAEVLGAQVQSGVIPLALVDQAVARILRAKLSLGIFEHPYADAALEAQEVARSEYRALARRAAQRSIVLLKNDGDLLPLSTAKMHRIAVVGPLADSGADCLGPWHALGRAEDAVSVVAGIRATAPRVEIRSARGCDVEGGGEEGFAEAVAATQSADVVIAVVGESEGMSGEASSRSELGVPGEQEALLQALHATGKPVVVVLMNGRPLTLGWTAEHVPAILETWFLGVEAGNAVADVLFGAYNPGGKLPVSFPRRVGQVPITYDAKRTGRPADAPGAHAKYSSRYLDVENTPLFAFGHGLSYTRFALAELTLSAAQIPRDGQLTVRVRLSNTGRRRGDEVVQLYVHQVVASVTRPDRQLVGFERVNLAPGETRRLALELPASALTLLNEHNERVIEAGKFELWVSTSSTGGLHAIFGVTER